MKRFTLVALATLIGTSSVVAFSPSVKAETREEYCRRHDCGREYRYEHDRDRNERDHVRNERERDRNERERDRYEHGRQRRWYDHRTGEWRYEHR